MSDKLKPLSEIYILRDDLGKLVDEGDWDSVNKTARSINKLIPLAVDKKTCGMEAPYIEGVYSIGTIRYTSAPKRAKRALDMMNNLIKVARRQIAKG